MACLSKKVTRETTMGPRVDARRLLIEHNIFPVTDWENLWQNRNTWSNNLCPRHVHTIYSNPIPRHSWGIRLESIVCTCWGDRLLDCVWGFVIDTQSVECDLHEPNQLWKPSVYNFQSIKPLVVMSSRIFNVCLLKKTQIYLVKKVNLSIFCVKYVPVTILI